MQIDYIAEPTLADFHASTAFVRGVRGPIGTGKSVGMCVEILAKASMQKPHTDGVRRSRWAAIRNTYSELKSTTIRTWVDWVPEELAPVRYDTPILSRMVVELPDKTTVDLEVLFISCDRPEDVKKLKSMELTGAWINEASELPKAILDMATGRVGRYPPKTQGGSSWSGVIMDTNSPDDDHWYYQLAEVDRPEGYEFFAQPPALIKTPAGYRPNPQAENVANQALGYEYWLRQVPGKDEHWIKVFLLGKYGTVHDGKPVYPEYNDTLHCRDLRTVQGAPLVVSLDFGLTPAAAITQTDARGRFFVLSECVSEDMDIREFLEFVLIPHLQSDYSEHWDKRDRMIKFVGDPAGAQRSQTDSRSCFDEFRLKGLRIQPAKSNAWLPRRGAVAWYLNKLSGGGPAFMIDPRCDVLRKGFNGGYKYHRLQVSGEARYTDEPVKNRYSHIHDALQYAAMETGGVQAVRKEGQAPTRVLPVFRPIDPSMGALG